ncbi:hypothetical protein AAG589_19145 [Isoptericola sp. F-RaC21]|uniref:hypothetical protein n=1 Tax=Isoptericola sp. F-RaC21 TaxID=3141452 RepID=UPI00315C188E
MATDDRTRPADRVWRRLPDAARPLLEGGLPGADLRSLLLDVAAARAAATRPADVLAQWRHDRMVRPSALDPRRLWPLEARLWAELPAEFDAVEPAPVAPLATAAALGGVSQHRVVTTTRLTEVVSDSSNVLAVEAADRRSARPRDEAVHVAAIQRQLRAQVFGPGAAAHFRLLVLVSSARASASARTEAGLLVTHVRAWQRLLGATVPHRRPRIVLTVWDDGAVAERVADTVLPAVRDDVVPVVEDAARERGRAYYAGVALRVATDDEPELGDGGLTTWTARLLGDGKERCLVSCVATERLVALAG